MRRKSRPRKELRQARRRVSWYRLLVLSLTGGSVTPERNFARPVRITRLDCWCADPVLSEQPRSGECLECGMPFVGTTCYCERCLEKVALEA